jgi:preprotein translocase subunit SecG
MGFLIGFFTFILILDALVVILLVIVQLPKKDAGAGMAFGGGAADALFGAGSGTVLTKITKYAAGIMFGLALLISVMQNQGQKSIASDLEKSMSKAAAGMPTTTLPTAQPESPTPPANPGTTVPVSPTN